MAIGQAVSQSIALTFVGGLFYALFLDTFCRSLRWQLFTDGGWKFRKTKNWPILTVTLFIFAFGLTTTALSIQTLMEQALECADPTTPPVPAMTWQRIVVCTFTDFSAVLADTILIYRCWIVYNKSRKVVIIPIILCVGGLVCAILQACWQAIQLGTLKSTFSLVNMSVGPGTVLTPFWGSTCALNAYCTAAIVYRIYMVAKKVENYTLTRATPLRFAMRVLVESGALYLAITIAHFVVWFTPNVFAISMISTMNGPIIGIAYNLIVIRTSQHRAEDVIYEKKLGDCSTLNFNPATPGNSEVMRTKTFEIHSSTDVTAGSSA